MIKTVVLAKRKEKIIHISIDLTLGLNALSQLGQMKIPDDYDKGTKKPR